MSSYYHAVKQNAASWILKTLSSKKDWRDQDINNQSTNYYYIPLIELARTSRKYDIRTLKDASYLLKDNQQVDIFGDDFDPYGMLVKILDAGLEVQKHSRAIQNRFGKLFKHLVMPLLALTIGAWLLLASEKNDTHVAKKNNTISVARTK